MVGGTVAGSEVKLYNPARDRVDADLCTQEEDGTVRDAAGRLIYRPGKHFILDKVHPAHGGVQAVFADPTFDEAFANMQRERRHR